MKKPIRDWLLAREEEALPSLNAIRRRAIVTERATWLESVAEVFRPDLGVWAFLAVVWLALAAAQLGVRWTGRASTDKGSPFSDTASLGLTSNERVSLLDGRY